MGPKAEGPFAKEKNARSIQHTKWPNTKLGKPLCMPKVKGVTTENRVDMVDSLNQFSGRRLKQQERLCCVWNAQSASTGNNCQLRGASTLNWVVTRRGRAR